MTPTIHLPPPDISDQKIKELILYISKRSTADLRFGAIKLNKLLFYCDFEAHKRFGKAITEKAYMNQAEGPVPRCLLPIRNEMINIDKTLAISTVTYYGNKQERTISLRDPDINYFSTKEIELVEEIIDKYWNLNASEISRESHNFIGWRLTKINDTIDYKFSLIGDRPPTEKEVEYGLSLI